MKILQITIMSLILCLFTQVGEAQSIGDSKRQCKILNKKRLGKISYKSPGHKRIKKSKSKQDFSKAESEPLLASTKKSITKPKLAASTKSKKAKKDEVALAGPNVILFNSSEMPSDEDKEAIREEVAELIANKTDGAPIKLDPLLFKDNNGQLEISNMRPFLVAVEFGLQGRIIIIDGHLGGLDQAGERLERVRQLMVNMGVKAELVSITGNRPLASASKPKRINFTVF